MKKGSILFITVLLFISVGYDFYRGYRETGSTSGGVVAVFFGLIILAFFWWLFSQGKNSS